MESHDQDEDLPQQPDPKLDRGAVHASKVQEGAPPPSSVPAQQQQQQQQQ